MSHGGFHGLEIPIRNFTGGRAVRVVHPPGQAIGEHNHAWALLTVPVIGSYEERYDGADFDVVSPAAVLHPAGRCHANSIHRRGLETISIEFDPAWLGAAGIMIPNNRSRHWSGGRVAIMARALARVWSDLSVEEARLRDETSNFLMQALRSQSAGRRPIWLARVLDLIDLPAPPSTSEIARKLDLHPAWLARSYRAAIGEGLHETLRRRRVERALQLLRETDVSLAEVAVAVGFCDQSHLNRSVRAFTGRTPVRLRAERGQLKQLSESCST